MILDYLGQRLGLPEIKRRLTELEQRSDVLEGRVENLLRDFGGYKNRADGDLNQMREKLDEWVATTEALVRRAEDAEVVERARRLLKRLKNNRTRIQKAFDERRTP